MRSRKNSGSRREIAYKFARVNFERCTVLLYQNTFEIKEKSFEIGNLIQTFGILLNSQQLMYPLNHMVAPKNSVIPELSSDVEPEDEV